MRRIWIAVRAFFVALVHGEAARLIEEALERSKQSPAAGAGPPVAVEPKPALVKKPEPKPAARSEALTLLAALQREARFVDFVKESLAGYSDAQIAAAAREVHRDCGAVLERFFALVPAVTQEEGSMLEVPAGYDAGRYRLIGNVTGQPPYRGRLVHPGWEATRCELPSWSGKEESARVVAPVEVEIG
ncbi:MAG: DUF2760 domain-containing protein [Thermoguttaceae bacterium]|jgi:hypothetical protein|nr:DUF2760 domain-containing protein [Thermoguttaceae bacterium]